MKLRLAFIGFLILCQAAVAQNRSNVWVFGRGNVMDFNFDPPALSTTSWAPTSQANLLLDANASNTWCDANGSLQMYFLNGKYFDGNGTLIPGGQVSGYSLRDCMGELIPVHAGGFMQSYSSDTIYHYFIYHPIIGGAITCAKYIRLNKIYFNGNSWSITFSDDYHGINDLGLIGFPTLIEDDIDHKHFLIVSNYTYNGNDNTVVVINNGEFETSNNNWPYSQMDVELDSVYPSRGMFYHPLLNKLFGWRHYNAPRRRWGFWSWTNQGSGNFTLDSVFFPAVIPGLTGSAALENFRLHMTTTSLDGRYMFCFSRLSNDPMQYIHCFRYDLLSEDSLDFVNKAVEIPMDTLLRIFELTDFQIAPDGNIYFQILEQRFQNDPGNRRIGRIVNPGDPDTSNIYFDYHFATLAPYSVYHSFPYFSSKQALPPPFKLLSDCSDSVSFDFTYKNVPDSVWWDFGDTTLGPLNHSTDKEPMVHYTSFGKRYVSVEMWLRGDSINRVGDTIDVQPSPHVSLPNDTLLCSGESILLGASQGFHADYLWSTGSTDSTLTVSQSGEYWVEVQNFCGTSRDTFNLVVIDPPQPVLRDTTLCDEWTYVMRVFADSADYLWNTGDTSPSIVPQSSSNYWVQISNPCGEIVDEADIEIRRCMCNVWIPSAFTPNGDGVNETFEIKVDCRDFDFTLDIFNRWGEHIYRQTDLNKPWDGRYNGEALPRGIYTYRIQYWGRDEQGLRWKDETGTINLLQ